MGSGMLDDRLISSAQLYGTPFYVYDADVIQRQYDLLRAVLPNQVGILYSVKANPLMGICQLLRSWGAGCEVASEGELLIALETGFQPDSIAFAGPGKTDAELRAAIGRKIGCIHVESVDEAILIDRLAAKLGCVPRVALRVNPDLSAGRAGLRMSGVASPFGIDGTMLDEAIRTVLDLRSVELVGFHVYVGSQFLNAEDIAGTFRHSIRLACDTAEKHNFPLLHLDLGGGFGVPYFPQESELNLELLRSLLADIWAEFTPRLNVTRVLVESGRFLLAESGVYVTKVLYRKTSKGNVFLVCDGGSHHHANSAFLGRAVRGNFPLRIAGKTADEAQVEEVTVSGRLCTPTDCLGQGIFLPRAEPGDLVVVEKSGAYGLTNSPIGFLSHPMPAEWLYWQGKLWPLREAGRPSDAMRGQNKLRL
ncbi:type III PLP-dependent enzyme [Paenibacillus prosopidis]|uniref:Diaminopimelate decarboxylase n=1 Tax=Paenibacillus prosopidis TaxID=630520 RepID=A0A368VRK8_9BACL|nr:type III PLP-dependent enzyme [Paenibacillus prosopidis]RCW43492.1 diaminopimelate decarboxylase [Paenibacillus prosopidis]